MSGVFATLLAGVLMIAVSCISLDAGLWCARHRGEFPRRHFIRAALCAVGALVIVAVGWMR